MKIFITKEASVLKLSYRIRSMDVKFARFQAQLVYCLKILSTRKAHPGFSPFTLRE